MTSERTVFFELCGTDGPRWRFELSFPAGVGLRVYCGHELRAAVTSDAIMNLVGHSEFAEEHAAALLAHAASQMDQGFPARILEQLHLVLSQWLWERAPFGN